MVESKFGEHVLFNSTWLLDETRGHFITLGWIEDKMIDICVSTYMRLTYLQTHKHTHTPPVRESTLFPEYLSSNTESFASRWTAQHMYTHIKNIRSLPSLLYSTLPTHTRVTAIIAMLALYTPDNKHVYTSHSLSYQSALPSALLLAKPMPESIHCGSNDNSNQLKCKEFVSSPVLLFGEILQGPSPVCVLMYAVRGFMINDAKPPNN